jgi:hypothetical protein
MSDTTNVNEAAVADVPEPVGLIGFTAEPQPVDAAGNLIRPPDYVPPPAEPVVADPQPAEAAPAEAEGDTVKVQLLGHSTSSTFESGIDGVPTITTFGVDVPRALLAELSDAAVISDVTLRLLAK